MNDVKLINKIKCLIVEAKEEEKYCTVQASLTPSRAEHFGSYASGLTEFRVKLESLLEDECGALRATTIEASA
ncbi:hypothetical protein PVK62_15220 [Aliivibrio sp. S3MY1]|uniref:Phage protein n=1 Tax=Aliivibrio wodanis TaxID=80852 RepID=A0A5Q4ZYF3_9GAMM|nr:MULTISPECIES: hypothetical protein [Aliivibrio]MDD9197177.1 hypothetical protein [Aliivibrio sp. S3MY1]VVV06898.1 hypothetical protein AW0309160_04392 [Aliivibrio wodanis]